MSIASELQDKINAKAAIKAAIEAKGVTVGDVKLNQYAAKIDSIAQDPSIPVGTGQHLVTFYDFDGKVLKRERVATGGNATAPNTPTHQYLTFAEWNNPFTNVQSDIDTGAIYNTTDGKTYLFITLTPVTGLAPTLFLSKSSTSLMTIDWGDGTTSTSTTSGNQSIQHTYAVAGGYIITVDNSAGGTWTIGHGGGSTSLFGSTYNSVLVRLYAGSFISFANNSLYSNNSLKYITYSSSVVENVGVFNLCRSLRHVNHPNNIVSPDGYRDQYAATRVLKYGSAAISGTQFYANHSIEKFTLNGSLTSIGALAFGNCFSVKYYIFLSTTPPTLANINAFTGINPICKIYVPDASVEAYKMATNWNNYANYIYPLSEKPQSNE